MEIRVAYEHSLASAPEEFIVQVPSQLVTDVPANVPRALLPEFIASLIVERSPTIGKIRNLRILSVVPSLQRHLADDPRRCAVSGKLRKGFAV